MTGIKASVIVRQSWGPGSDGGPCLVEVEELAVQTAVLVEVAAGNLDSSRVGHAAHLERVEAGGADQPFDRRRCSVVIGGVEEHCPPRRAIRRACERVGPERAECLHVVRASGKQSGDDGARGLVLGQCPHQLAVLVDPERVRGIDDDLTLEQVHVRRGQLLDRVEPDGEDDGVGLRDRLFDRGGAREVTQLLRKRCRLRFVLRREDDGLAAADQMPRQRSTDVADSDDCGCHGDSSFYLTPQLTSHTHLTFPRPRAA